MRLRRSSSVDSLQLNSIQTMTMVTTSSPTMATTSTTENSSNFSFSSEDQQQQQQQQHQQQHQSPVTFKCNDGSMDPLSLIGPPPASSSSTTTTNALNHYYNYYNCYTKTYCGRSMIDQTTQTPEDWRTTNCSVIAAVHHHHSSSTAVAAAAAAVVGQQQQCFHYNGAYLEQHHYHRQQEQPTTTIVNPEQLDASTITMAMPLKSIVVSNRQTQSLMFQTTNNHRNNGADQKQDSIGSMINTSNDGGGDSDSNPDDFGRPQQHRCCCFSFQNNKGEKVFQTTPLSKPQMDHLDDQHEQSRLENQGDNVAMVEPNQKDNNKHPSTTMDDNNDGGQTVPVAEDRPTATETVPKVADTIVDARCCYYFKHCDNSTAVDVTVGDVKVLGSRPGHVADANLSRLNSSYAVHGPNELAHNADDNFGGQQQQQQPKLRMKPGPNDCDGGQHSVGDGWESRVISNQNPNENEDNKMDTGAIINGKKDYDNVGFGRISFPVENESEPEMNGDFNADSLDNQENDQNLFNNFQRQQHQKSNQLRNKMIMMLMMNNHGRIDNVGNGKCRTEFSNNSNMNMTMAVRNIHNYNGNSRHDDHATNTLKGNNKNQGNENVDDHNDAINPNIRMPKSRPITIPKSMKSSNQQLFGFFGAYHPIDVNNNNNQALQQPALRSNAHQILASPTTNNHNVHHIINAAAAVTNINNNINMLSSNSVEEFNQEIAELMEKNQIECEENDDNVDYGEDSLGMDCGDTKSKILNHANKNHNGGRLAPVSELMLIAGDSGGVDSTFSSYPNGGGPSVAGGDLSPTMIMVADDNAAAGGHSDWQNCMPFLCDDLDIDEDNSIADDPNASGSSKMIYNGGKKDIGDGGGPPVIIATNPRCFISTHKRVLDETDFDQWSSNKEKQQQHPIVDHRSISIVQNKTLNEQPTKVKTKQGLSSLHEDIGQISGAISKCAKLNKSNNSEWMNPQMLPSPKMISSDIMEDLVFEFKEHSTTVKNKPKPSSKPITKILDQSDFPMANNFFMEFNRQQHHSGHYMHSKLNDQQQPTSHSKGTSFKLKPSYQSAFLPVAETTTASLVAAAPTRWMQTSN